MATRSPPSSLSVADTQMCNSPASIATPAKLAIAQPHKALTPEIVSGASNKMQFRTPLRLPSKDSPSRLAMCANEAHDRAQLCRPAIKRIRQRVAVGGCCGQASAQAAVGDVVANTLVLSR